MNLLLLLFLFINSIFCYLTLRVGISELHKKKDFLFSVLTVSLITFLLTNYLKDLDVQLGLALGLFAIFSIVRFRTVRIPINQMSMIFLCMGISVINSLNTSKFELIPEMLIINFVVLSFIFVFKKIT